MDFCNKSVGHLAAPRQPQGVHPHQLPAACVWSVRYNSKTFGNQLSICSQVALNPGPDAKSQSFRSELSSLPSFRSASGLPHSNGTPPPAPPSPKEVWEREPGCQRFQGGSGFFYYQVQWIQTRLWTVNTPRGLRVIVKVGTKLGTGKHTLKHREWSPLRNNLRRCQCFGYYVTVN